jgi:hypothetical protein
MRNPDCLSKIYLLSKSTYGILRPAGKKGVLTTKIAFVLETVVIQKE